MITELRTLVAVARFGTFAAAGDRIGLTQAAVSGHMKRLEEELGFSLFDRTGRSATLNAAGLRTLERARSLISSYEALKEAAEDGGSGLIRIGGIASVQPTRIPRATALFRRRHPRHQIHIESGDSLRLLDMTDAAKLDLAVLLRPAFEIPKSLVWRSLATEPYMLAVPKTVSGDDWAELLGKRPLIRYDRASPGGRQVERFLQARGIAVHESIEADDVQTLLALVAGGLGVALFPATEAARALSASVRVVSLGESTFHREIGFITSRKRDPVIERFGACLIETAAE